MKRILLTAGLSLGLSSGLALADGKVYVTLPDMSGIARDAAQKFDSMGEIVIAKRRRVISQPVQRADGRVDVMRGQSAARQFIAKRRAVQQIAVVEQHQVGMGRALCRDQGRQTRQPAAPRLRAKVHMQVGGAKYPQRDGGRRCRPFCRGGRTLEES